ncbi:MAG: threonine--tRNA ligase [Lachnospiraceae bacterium]|jgi:threonyl-tRNA synthetase|nr:threonine--tRNA ligase [Lachnospiraceae bacterium]MCH4031967.1 threonine--tRNA ligase [Lachnospiraceae bacterium]MCH4070586.1 threonine--tRNA ligase [Lachnospiraceae bacterium]MCH4109258.1 threonine--tRNA ligase [Lachnospiraceae bacterium]MCI1302903.1 threonine--tRNA ligase [Lachnospiraceae bacterium]
MEKEEFAAVYRHSMAHILAKAVIEIFGKENVQYAIGPQIADGCYYDFVLPRTLTQDDFETIEKKMHEIIKRREDWTRKEVTRGEALKIFEGQKFKTELIKDLPEGETISVYYTGNDYVDLCRGPHIDNSQELMNVAFKVKSVSGAYWRGDEKRDSMQRIYLYVFPNKEELKAHLALVREAQERDHKKIGPQLDLFMFNETAPGMPYWLPRGWKSYRALVKYWREVHDRHGYQEISAPVINNKKLWLISGHWAHYQNNMFIVPGTTMDLSADDVMAAKPMNCPNAMMTYKRTVHSYKELPIRYNELDVIHRKEKSGELNGLFRVQEFRQDDDHTFVTEDQIESEIDDVMDIADQIYKTFGITYRAELSTRPDDYMGDINVWNKAEAALRRILDNKYGAGNYEVNEGDGAFYGPKIDLQMKDALGREWQTGTIQLDFQLPHNFGLTYTAPDGSLKQPVVIHRAIFGSIERFMGILIENFKGAFPFWMSPYQVGIVPIRTEHNEYARKVELMLADKGIRVESDYADKNMNEKIKAFRTYKDPYVLVIGDKEVADGTVSVTVRGQKQQLHGVPLEAFVAACDKQNKERTLELMNQF